MPVLQFSLAMLSGLINGNQADNTPAGADSTGKKSGGDQFSSLLDVVGNIGDTGNQQGSSKKDEVKDPVAAAVNAPVPFRDPLDKVIQKVISHKVDDKKSDDSPEPAARANDDSENSDNSTAAKAADKPALREAKGADKLDKSVGEASENVVDENVTEDELKAKISERVDNLTNLMNIIAQLLAGAGAVQPQTTPQVQANAVDDSAALLVGGAVQGDTSPLAVFADLKNVLSQLQQFLQAANAQGESQGSTQNTPLTEEQNAALTAINNALQSDLNALKNLFPNGLSADDKKSLLAQTAELPQTQVSDDSHQPMFTPVADVKTLLEDDIKLIKDALQKFKDDRAAEPLKFEAVIPKSNIQPLITEAANNNTPVTPQANNRVETPLFSSNAVITTVAEQAAGQQTTQPQNNSTPLPAASAAQTASTQGDSNSGGNFSNNSGQGGNSQAQFTIGGLTATSARTVGAGTQFSNLLNRADQVPVSEQVVFHIKSAIGSGNTKIIIQLSPEDLGKLDITLDVDAKGKTGVTVTADNKQALDLLQRDSSGLQKALADAGLKTDENSLSFNLRGGEKEGQGQNQYQAASQYQKSQPDEILPDEINIASMAAVTRSYTVNLPDGLDIKI